MNNQLVLLIVEAMVVYAAVLLAHSARRRLGIGFFYGLIGCVTAVMSWVTDAGMRIEYGVLSFNVGSTIFYTSILLGVFVIYVFDGPRATRFLIATVVLVSALMPLIAATLHFQAQLLDVSLANVPVPSLRINTASVVTTLVNLFFLAVVWESFGQLSFNVHLWTRTFLTLLGVMWLDVLLFTTGAFAGTSAYWGIMGGTLLTRLVVSLMAFPLLYLYIQLESRRTGVSIENRPVWAILREMAEINKELTLAQQEIERRKSAEVKLQRALSEVKTLQGLIPICSHCKKVRDDKGSWERIESYIRRRSDANFSHGVCPECMAQLYPDIVVSESELGE